MKKCNKCGEIKPYEEFHRNKNSKGGFNTVCKSCCKKKDADRYKRKREDILKQKKEYYSSPEAKRRQLEYFDKHRQRYREMYKEWARNNPERRKLINERRRSRELSQVNTLTIEEWETIKAYFNHSCAYCGISEEEHVKKCGERLHQEHIKPLSQGGTFTKENIIPACRSCNSSKYVKDIREWYPNHKSYDIERAIRIKKYK